MNIRLIFYVIGLLQCILALSMVLPLAVDLYYINEDWKVFLGCIIVTFFSGALLVLSNRTDNLTIRVREGFLLTTLSWISVCFFGALPFWFSELEMSFTDSLFESVSGFTTTGATVIAGLEEVPPGLLIWRAMSQWLGGIGIIVMAISLLPFLGIGGMQLFRTESSENEKALPRARELAGSIFYIYGFLTFACLIAYIAAGFSPFHALAHAMTTISTGGFSTFDTSFAAHDAPSKEIVAILFMIIGSLPFILYLKFVMGRPEKLFQDSQVKWFFAILLSIIAILCFWLFITATLPLSFESLLHVAFSVTAIMTGTGYANTDYGAWGPFAVALFFFVMVIGGCAGSTTCGLKIFRLQVLYAVTNTQIKKLLSPHGIFTSLYNNRPIPPDVPLSVMSFFFLFALSFTVIATLLSMCGLDYMTAMSGAASAIANVGPGLGPIIGPTGNYAGLPDPAKWTLCFGMLLGRLELFTIMVLFMPRFWRP